jgi:fatty acid desaturase
MSEEEKQAAEGAEGTGEQDEKILKARKIAKKKADFIKHFIIYIVVIVFLAVINNVTYRGYQWWLWPALGWGIGVTLNFFSVYVFKGRELEDRIMKSELDKMDRYK